MNVSYYRYLEFEEYKNYIDTLNVDEMIDEMLKIKNLRIELENAYETFKSRLFTFTFKRGFSQEPDMKTYREYVEKNYPAKRLLLKEYLQFMALLGDEINIYIDTLYWKRVFTTEVVEGTVKKDQIIDEARKVKILFDKLALLANTLYIQGARGFRDLFDPDYEVDDINDERVNYYNHKQERTKYGILFVMRFFEPLELIRQVEKTIADENESFNEEHKESRDRYVCIPDIEEVDEHKYVVHGPWGDFYVDDKGLLNFLKPTIGIKKNYDYCYLENDNNDD